MSHTPLDRAYHWEKTTPDRVYLTQPIGGGRVQTFTWKQTLDEARRMATYLGTLGFPGGTKIALLTKNTAHFIIADLAIWMAGHVSVALYPTLGAETVRQILDHAESKLLMVGKVDDWEKLKKALPVDLPVVALPLSPATGVSQWNDLIRQHEPVAGSPLRDSSELAILVYTSGSTGTPKGVMHAFAALMYGTTALQPLLHACSDDRMISYLPLAHVAERAAVEMASLQAGFQVFFTEGLDTFLVDLRRAAPTLFFSVPRLWLKFQLGVTAKMPQKKLDRLLRIPIVSRLIKKKILAGLGLDHVRYAVTGSAPLPPEVIQWYRDLGLELLEGYGMTEDFAYSHISFPGKARVGYVGNAAPGVEVKLSDDGEVLVKSPANMLGYFKEPEMTAECYTPDGFFKTGDRGERDHEGRLKITGRVKELFKTSKGKYVAPAPIENLLNVHPFLEMSCVAGSGQPQPHAVVVLSETLRRRSDDPAVQDEVNAALDALRRDVNRAVEAHEALDFIAVVKDEWSIENGFLTPTMKIKRAALEAMYSANAESWYALKKPVVWQKL